MQEADINLGKQVDALSRDRNARVRPAQPRREMRCRSCGHTATMTPRAERFKTFEWVAGEPTYLCQPCGARATPRRGIPKSVTPRLVANWQRRRQIVASSRLQKDCLRFIDEHGLSIAQLERLAGINRNTLHAWLQRSGKLGPPSMARANLKRLAGALGISIEQAIDDAGGKTFEQRLQDKEERRVIAAMGGHAGKGRLKPPDATAAMVKVGGLIGAVIAERASLSGAEGGCQAETGSAAAMAAGAATEMLGGTPSQVGHATALAMQGTLGLVCDPLGGLVELPCVFRNATGAAIETAAVAPELTAPVAEIAVTSAVIWAAMPLRPI